MTEHQRRKESINSTLDARYTGRDFPDLSDDELAATLPKVNPWTQRDENTEPPSEVQEKIARRIATMSAWRLENVPEPEPEPWTPPCIANPECDIGKMRREEAVG